jgi:glycosyltransferase involved in cell wall biosynthesis
MPKVLILVAHRPQRSPSQRYRFEQYLPYLTQHGYEFTWSPLLNESDDCVFYSKGNFPEKLFILLKSLIIRLKDVRRFSHFDILFVQREALFLGTSFVERRAMKSGKKVIFDFDDAIWLADTSPSNKKWEWVKNPIKFNINVSCASIVIAGNKYLAEKAGAFNKNVVVIPTTIDTLNHVPIPEKRNKNKLTVGWSGSISTIKHFESLIPVLQTLKNLFDDRIRFVVYGDSAYEHKMLEIKGVAWSAEGEVDMLNSFDIGIMPLPEDDWTKGKCGLKALSYMACGVPVVASAVGMNVDIIHHGKNGFLASSDEEWLEALKQLLQSFELRESLGKEGRKTVEACYSVESQKNNYLNIFRSC